MGTWRHSLKFNVGPGGIHQLPQTTGNGVHSLPQKVMWDAGSNIPHLVLQLFNRARLCPVHPLLCPAPQEKVTGREISTSAQQPPNSTPHSVQQSALVPEQSSGQPSLLPLCVLPLATTAHTIDGRIMKSYFVTYIYVHMIFIMIILILENL